MITAELIVNLLEGKVDLDLMDVESVLKSKDKQGLLNVIAIKFLNKDWQNILELCNEAENLGVLKDVDDLTLRIIEYKILALLALEDYKEILSTLRSVRNKILYLFVFPYPIMHLTSLEDLLDEQKLLFIKRQTMNISQEIAPPISGVVILSIFNKYNKAREVLSRAEYSEFLAYLGVLLSYISRANIGKKLVDIALGLEDTYITRVANGVIYYLMNNYRKAFNEFMIALRKDSIKSSNTEALVNLAQLFLLTGEYSLALDYITRAIRKNPDIFARFIRGLILLNLNRTNEAIVAFKALLGSRDRRIQIYSLLGLAECYLSIKNYNKAFEMVWKAHMLNPKDKIVSLYAKVLKRLSESKRG